MNKNTKISLFITILIFIISILVWAISYLTKYPLAYLGPYIGYFVFVTIKLLIAILKYNVSVKFEILSSYVIPLVIQLPLLIFTN